jgi:biopolymer transport protein ExbD
MAKFKKDRSSEGQNINTASLPDIVFMLLFFFMVATTMKTNDPKLKIKSPTASEVVKLEKKRLVSYILIGKPSKSWQDLFGTSPRIQLNDQIEELDEIITFVELEKANLPEELKQALTVSLKVDVETKMGIVSDVKQELRKANALKVNYSTKTGKVKE